MADEMPTDKVGKGSFLATRSYVERGITVTDGKPQHRAGSQKVVLLLQGRRINGDTNICRNAWRQIGSGGELRAHCSFLWVLQCLWSVLMN